MLMGIEAGAPGYMFVPRQSESFGYPLQGYENSNMGF